MEPPPVDQENPAAEFDPALVEHAVRCWEAERENAARLANRVALVLSVVAALFGLGLFRLEWFRRADEVPRLHPEWSYWLLKSPLTGALIFFGISFWKLLKSTSPPAPRGAVEKPRPHRGHAVQAADYLALGRSVIEQPPGEGSEVRRLVFARVYRAYLDLRARNARKRQALDEGQVWFLLGLFVVGLTLRLYIWFAEPPMRGPTME